MAKIKKFICTECRSEYISSNNTVPHIVVWYDGHICTPQLYAEQDKQKINKTKVGVENDIWTTWYN